MSRGLGKVERDVVAFLQKQQSRGMPGRISLSGLVRFLYEASPMELVMGDFASYRSEYQAVKRATKSLARKGYITRRSGPKSCIVELKCNSPTDTLKKAGRVE